MKLSKLLLPIVCFLGALTGGIFLHLFGAQMGGGISYFLETQYPGFIREESWLAVVSNPDQYDAYSGYSVLAERGSDVAVLVSKEHIRSSDPYLWINAATYLGSREGADSVPYLIESLRHKASRSKEERIALLTELTGKNYGADFFAWRSWYEGTENAIEIDWTSALGQKIVDS